MENKYFDSLETRDPAEREIDLMARLVRHVAHAQSKSSFFAERLRGVEAAAVTSRAALAKLPVTRKHDLIELQKKTPPLGGLNGTEVGQLAHVFSSPGPIYDLDGRRPDWWRFARAMWASGFRPGDLIHNTFSYHFTPGAWMVEAGAAKVGCPVFPAGVGQTEQQLAAIGHLRPSAYTGTPSFLKILMEKAEEAGMGPTPFSKALFSGEAYLPRMRTWLKERGVIGRQCFATADVGCLAYETEAEEGLLVEENILLEVVLPGTGQVLPDGEVGELVVTVLNPDYPMVRFSTGDLTAIMPGTSPCGRTNMRIRGWMGRADQTAKIKGMFVHPEQIAAVAKKHSELGRCRLIIDNPEGNDRMTLRCEASVVADGFLEALQKTLRDITKLRGDIEFVAVGSLPNDGKIIEDIRKFD